LRFSVMIHVLLIQPNESGAVRQPLPATDRQCRHGPDRKAPGHKHLGFGRDFVTTPEALLFAADFASSKSPASYGDCLPASRWLPGPMKFRPVARPSSGAFAEYADAPPA